MTNPVWRFLPGIHSYAGNLGVALGALSGGATPGSAAFPAANDAIFVPFYIPRSVLIKRLFSINGSTVSGNIDLGIYTIDGAKITSIGSTAQAGTTGPQFFNITDLMLGPGAYYLAVAMDNTTGTLFRASLGIRYLQAVGVMKQATAFALPASATFATVTATYLPLIGAEITEIL